MRNKLALLFVAASVLPAAAHVMLEQASARPGSHYVARFHVGHGCSGSPTIALRIAIPDAVPQASAMPMPGWTVTMDRAPGGRVRAIRWSGGKLAPTTPGIFEIHMRLPGKAQTLAFPTVQTCETGQEEWTERGEGVRHPAPLLAVSPTDAPAAMPDMAGMHHM